MPNRGNPLEDVIVAMLNHLDRQEPIAPHSGNLWQQSKKQTDEAFKGTKLSSVDKTAAESSCYTYLCISEKQRRSRNSLTSRIEAGITKFLALVGGLSIVAIVAYLIYNFGIQ